MIKRGLRLSNETERRGISLLKLRAKADDLRKRFLNISGGIPLRRSLGTRTRKLFSGKAFGLKTFVFVLILVVLLGYYGVVVYPRGRALVEQGLNDVNRASPEVKPLVDVSTVVQEWERALYERYRLKQITQDGLVSELCNHWGLSVEKRDIEAWAGRMNVYTNTLDFFGFQLYIPVPIWFKLIWNMYHMGETASLLGATISLMYLTRMRKGTLTLVAILGVAALLRLASLDLAEFKTDEGQNCLIMLDMVRGHDFPLLGPVASSGGYHFGPIMYYILYPAFLVSLNPRAASAVIAILNVCAVYICYKLGAELFNDRVGLISAALFAVSPMAIIFSIKFWNYDFLPFSVTALFYSLVKVGKNDQRFLIPLFASLALALQSHATTLTLIPALLITACVFKLRDHFKVNVRYLGLAILAYVLIYLPVLCHEVVSNFSDTRMFVTWALQHSGETTRSLNYIQQLAQNYASLTAPSASYLNSYLDFGMDVGPDIQNYVELALFVASLSTAFLRFTRDSSYLVLWTWALTPLPFYFWGQLGYIHYFVILYPVQYLIVAALLGSLADTRRLSGRLFHIRMGLVLSFALTIFVLAGQFAQTCGFYYQVREHGGGAGEYGATLLDKERVVNYIIQSSGTEPFRVLYVTQRGDSPYRYLLRMNHAKLSSNASLTYLIVDTISWHPNFVVSDPGGARIDLKYQLLIDRSIEARKFGLVTVYKIDRV